MKHIISTLLYLILSNTGLSQSNQDPIKKIVLDNFWWNDTTYTKKGDIDSIYTFMTGEIVEELYLDNDSVKDYFVIESFPGGGQTFAYFYNGLTGQEIENEDMAIISRSGVPIIHMVVDAELSTPQKEIAVLHGGGGTLGHGYYCGVYQFQNDKMTPVFKETVTYLDNEQDRFTTLNYVDFLYSDSRDVSEIKVCKGLQKKKLKAYNLEFNADLNSDTSKYVYQNGAFVKTTPDVYPVPPNGNRFTFFDEYVIVRINVANIQNDLRSNKVGFFELEFLVNTDGSVSNFKLLSPLGPELNAEFIRIISDSKWTPAQKDGKSIKQKVVVYTYIEY